MKGPIGLVMLVWRQVTRRWENDPVWRYDGGNRVEDRGGSR